MERLSVTLKGSPSPRNPRGLTSMPLLGSPGSQRSGLEDHGYLERLGILSMSVQLPTFPEKLDEPKTDSADSTSFAITPTQSRLSANETAPHLNPVVHSASSRRAKPVRTCLATRTRVSARLLHNTMPGDGLNRRYQCQARYGTR